MSGYLIGPVGGNIEGTDFRVKPNRRAVSLKHWRGAARGSILTRMVEPDHDPPIRVGAAPDGSLPSLVAVPPGALPPVPRRDLERAWYAARRAALAEQWGTVRVF